MHADACAARLARGACDEVRARARLLPRAGGMGSPPARGGLVSRSAASRPEPIFRRPGWSAVEQQVMKEATQDGKKRNSYRPGTTLTRCPGHRPTRGDRARLTA